MSNSEQPHQHQDSGDQSEVAPESQGSARRTRPRSAWWPILLLIALIALAFYLPSRQVSEISYDFFILQVSEQNVTEVTLAAETATGEFKQPPVDPSAQGSGGKGSGGNEAPAKDKNGGGGKAEPIKRLAKRFRVTLPSSDASRAELLKLLLANNVKVSNRGAGSAIYFYYALLLLLPILVVGAMWVMMRRSRDPMSPGGFLSGFTRSPAKRYEGTRQAVTFDDVAGIEHVKEELQEIVQFLKEPEKFQRLGARIPKGVLLNGAPGTGKTLLARAVAGEAGVPFFSVSGSEFIQMFVGVGASRVRDLFRTAKTQAPAIIFIDEIDAVGRQRGAGVGGGHDEREQTLNQILSEMDGFTPTDSVIVLSATNRPDVLDPALLRPGRFDRHITVDRPTRRGRLEIFKVHVRHVPLGDDVSLERLADGTVGLTGADIRNIVNEAALWAARNDKTRVDMADFEFALDKVLMGPQREEVLKGIEKRRTAYHEAGHTVAAWRLKGGHRVHKVTIIPRGRALGATQILPAEDRLSVSRTEILDRLVALLAGRAAERLIFDETTAGAENDLERATELARRMVTHWGMSKRIGPVSIKLSEDDPFLGREIQRGHFVSEATLQTIDSEVSKCLNEADQRADSLLRENRSQLDELVERLMQEEELTESEIEDVLGAPHWCEQRDESSEDSDDTPDSVPAIDEPPARGASED